MSSRKMIQTGIQELDNWLGGGISPYMMLILAGEPGTGKTILAQNILFNRIRKDDKSKALYISTLSEPLPNVIRHMKEFLFFDEELFADRVVYRDLGSMIRENKLDDVVTKIREMIEEVEPTLLVIDSFKAINDMSQNTSQFRQFCFNISVMLSTMRVTTILVGEYRREDVSELTEFAVADGIIHLSSGLRGGEFHRLLSVVKMRGQEPKAGEALFTISDQGIKVYDLEAHISNLKSRHLSRRDPLLTRVPGLDHLLGGGFFPGCVVLVSGVSGTGKTTLCLQTVMKAAENGERCLYFSVEQPPQNLQEQAESLGFEMQPAIDADKLRIRYTPISEIRVESALEEIVCEIDDFNPSYIVLDSSSVLLNQSDSAAFQRRKIWEIGQIAKAAGCVAFLTSDIPGGESTKMSRFGVEETLADCVVRLSLELAPGCNQRFVEVLKHRSHKIIQGKWYMEIGKGGLDIFHIKKSDEGCANEPDSISSKLLEPFVEGQMAYCSSWLCFGQPGVGKSSLAVEFVLEGLLQGESALVVTVDGPADQARKLMKRKKADIDEWEREGRLVFLDLFSQTGAEGRNWEAMLLNVQRHLNVMQIPLRLVLDSLTPLHTVFREQFFELIMQKNRLLRQCGVAVFDTATNPGLNDDMISMTNFYDVVINLASPDQDDQSLADDESVRRIAVTKARGVKMVTGALPYAISEQDGLIINR